MKTGATKDQATTGLVPKLRFPEFRDSNEWEQATLGEVSSILKGKGVSKADLDPGGPRACIRYGELYTCYGATIKEAVSRTKVPDSELFLSKLYDVIVPSSGETKLDIARASCVLADGIALGGDLNVIRSKLNGTFLSYCLNGPKRPDIAKVAQGDTVVHLYPHQLAALKIAVPEPAEQQKIADCLSTLDELIAAQGRKVEALKTHKKGLMQQLFPREGESQPRLRFPEFQDAGNWKKMTLGTAANFYNGRAYKQEELLDAGKYKVLRVGNFFTNNNWYYSNLELDKTKYCEDGDLLYAWSASFGPRVWSGEKAIYHYHIWKVVEQSGIDKRFLFIVLEHETEQMKAKTTNGLGIMHITKGAIESWESLFPGLAEQRKLAERLVNLEGAISAEARKLELLTVHKEGLMQQLFPSIDDIVI